MDTHLVPSNNTKNNVGHVDKDQRLPETAGYYSNQISDVLSFGEQQHHQYSFIYMYTTKKNTEYQSRRGQRLTTLRVEYACRVENRLRDHVRFSSHSLMKLKYNDVEA